LNNELGFDTELQNGRIVKQDTGMRMQELIDNKKYTEVSFMIFRTGSCLIVGNCSEKILKFIFEFIKTMLHNEYANIHVVNDEVVTKNKKTKLRKKTVMMSDDYYKNVVQQGVALSS
jgi:hypothetical protein